MNGPTLQDVNAITLEATRTPKSRAYWIALVATAAGIAALSLALFKQVKTGMGVTGLSEPVNWGLYIANFVFWVGIGHAGTLISAILFLARARWRDSVSRSAEAMTVFAVMTAGLFPLIHLGRIWRFYFIIPYPSQRQLWPNFVSPLIWDELAVGTYLTVSTIFFLVGLIPDVAAARDWSTSRRGPNHWKTRLFRLLALGWSGAASQWRHFERGYLFFAALATPLVISVHSVVSWDFAMGLISGWHTTIYAPYFVSGAVHSGLAMVVLLVVPMRRLLKLERLIKDEHFDLLAQTMLVTTFLMAYFYLIEPLIAWYSGEIYARQYGLWQAFSRMGTLYWPLVPLNVLMPLTLVVKRARKNIAWLMVVSAAVILGMYDERVMIVTGSPAHDFLPHNWGSYLPRLAELTITVGSFGFFLFLFLAFAKLLPTAPISDFKALLDEKRTAQITVKAPARRALPVRSAKGALAVYTGPADLIAAAERALETGYVRLEAFSPYKLPKLHKALGNPDSPIRLYTLAGALAGFAGGLALAIGASLVNNLLVGGKGAFAYIPFWIPATEGLILVGSLANLGALIVLARLTGRKPPPYYDPRFSQDGFGLFIEADERSLDEVREVLARDNPEEIRIYG